MKGMEKLFSRKRKFKKTEIKIYHYIILKFINISNSLIIFTAADVIMMFCLYKNQVQASDVRNFEVESESKKTTPEV